MPINTGMLEPDTNTTHAFISLLMCCFHGAIYGDAVNAFYLIWRLFECICLSAKQSACG